LASANGDFDLVLDAAVLHELGAPHGSISPCAARIAQARVSLLPQPPPVGLGDFTTEWD
jgi:hypothetical protein